jgi:hypothetical protein
VSLHSSLWLFWVAPTRLAGFGLKPYYDPSVIMGPVLDMIVIYRDVEHASCEELNIILNM